MVAIMAAMLAMPEPRLIVSAIDILRVILLGTTISHPGSILVPTLIFATMPFM